jgi:hypothetical protein
MVGSLGQGDCASSSALINLKITTIMALNFLGKGSKPALCDQQ